MTKYNGHRSWNAWNISLWINNDEHLYNYARDLVKRLGIARASRRMANELKGATTPDGGRFNLTCIREAICDIL